MLVVSVHYASPGEGAVCCEIEREVFLIIGQRFDGAPIVARAGNGLAMHACKRREA